MTARDGAPATFGSERGVNRVTPQAVASGCALLVMPEQGLLS